MPDFVGIPRNRIDNDSDLGDGLIRPCTFPLTIQSQPSETIVYSIGQSYIDDTDAFPCKDGRFLCLGVTNDCKFKSYTNGTGCPTAPSSDEHVSSAVAVYNSA